MINQMSAIDNGIADLFGSEEPVENPQVEEPSTEEVTVDNGEPEEGGETVEEPTEEQIEENPVEKPIENKEEIVIPPNGNIKEE